MPAAKTTDGPARPASVAGAPRGDHRHVRRASSPGRGYHATGINELCTANELGKGALYHYIGSKEELLAAIHDRVMDEVMAGADRVAEAGGSPSAAARRCSARSCSTSSTATPTTCGSSCTSSRRSPASGPSSSASGAAPTSVGSRPSCGRASTSGEFRDVDPRLTAMAWLGMHNYTYLWLKPGGRLSARDVAKPFAEIFMRGITAPTA